MISSAHPPETHAKPGLSTAKLRVVVADLEDIAPALAAAGEPKLAAHARTLSSQLYALLTRPSGEQPAVEAPRPPTVPPNTGV